MIKAVLVDVDNTLLDFRRGSEEAAREACASFGVQADERIFNSFAAVTKRLWGEIERGDLTFEELLEIRWDTVFEECGVKGVDGRKVESAFHELLQTSAIPVDGAEDMLRSLSSKYPVYVASNAPAGQQQRRMKAAGFDEYISAYFISDEIGAYKPSAQFFEKAFSKIQALPCEAVMIGDSPAADIAGAKSYGLKTILFDAFGTAECEDCDFKATALSDIPAMISRFTA